ncbi:MAG: hypothetical protein HQK79_23125 [Desulfobacterales bacterium]|nr:hypothetical protein [Desulfobacterales bacterium]MBF0398309.1 hypothetical protein [Desulfobacterales bacterium]
MTQKMENQIKALSIYFKCKDQIQPQKQKPQLRLVIELIDPISIAKKQSIIAKIVSGIAPNIIVSEVYREAKKRAVLDVKRHNVEANINIISI